MSKKANTVINVALILFFWAMAIAEWIPLLEDWPSICVVAYTAIVIVVGLCVTSYCVDSIRGETEL